ncbi:MAG: hypothetical protein AB7G23_02855 [Vicinamibacterales bacterium]
MARPESVQPTTPLWHWVHERRAALGTLRQIAVAIRMTESGFRRALKMGAMEVENLLRLADVGGGNPGEVLRLGGKEDVALMIERFYGLDRSAGLNASQRQILDLWDAMSPSEQAAIRPTLEVIVKARRAAAAPSGVRSAPRARGRKSSTPRTA